MVEKVDSYGGLEETIKGEGKKAVKKGAKKIGGEVEERFEKTTGRKKPKPLAEDTEEAKDKRTDRIVTNLKQKGVEETIKIEGEDVVKNTALRGVKEVKDKTDQKIEDKKR